MDDVVSAAIGLLYELRSIYDLDGQVDACLLQVPCFRFSCMTVNTGF